MKSNRRSIIFLAILMVLILPGCLKIKQQSITAKFDKDSRKMTFLVVYEGLYVGMSSDKQADREKDLAKAKEQLAAFVGSQQRFDLFNGSIDSVNLGREASDNENVSSIKKKMASQIDIRNGAFLLNDDNELSIYQIITIQDYSEFVKLFNEVISGVIDEEATKQLSKPRDERGVKDLVTVHAPSGRIDGLRE